jgi:hypothetical protein
LSDFENDNNPNIENKKSIQKWENISKYKCKSSDSVLMLGTKIMQKGIISAYSITTGIYIPLLLE